MTCSAPWRRQQGARDGAALAGGADDRDRALGVDAVGDAVDVVVGRVHEPGRWPVFPLVRLAHVEHLQLSSSRCVQGRARRCAPARPWVASPRASWSCRRPGSRRRSGSRPPRRGARRGQRRRRRGRPAPPPGRGRPATRASSRILRARSGCTPRPGCARRRTAGRCEHQRSARRRRCLRSTWRGASGST